MKLCLSEKRCIMYMVMLIPTFLSLMIYGIITLIFF